MVHKVGPGADANDNSTAVHDRTNSLVTAFQWPCLALPDSRHVSLLLIALRPMFHVALESQVPAQPSALRTAQCRPLRSGSHVECKSYQKQR